MRDRIYRMGERPNVVIEVDEYGTVYIGDETFCCDDIQIIAHAALMRRTEYFRECGK